MSAWRDMEAIEGEVLSCLWQIGYRRVSGGELWNMTVAAIDYLDGRIGKKTFSRKFVRQIRRLDKAIARQDSQLLDLREVQP